MMDKFTINKDSFGYTLTTTLSNGDEFKMTLELENHGESGYLYYEVVNSFENRNSGIEFEVMKYVQSGYRFMVENTGVKAIDYHSEPKRAKLNQRMFSSLGKVVTHVFDDYYIVYNQPLHIVDGHVIDAPDAELLNKMIANAS